MPDWIIHYSDGTTFSSDDGEWKDAPGWDCQVVLFRDPIVKWGIRHDADYFYLARDGTVVGIYGTVALVDFVTNVLGVVKVGRMLTQYDFTEVMRKATADRAALQAGA